MKLRVLIAVLFSALCITTVSPVASAGPAGSTIPAPAPGLELLNATSSTRVAAGGEVQLAFNYRNVQSRPFSLFVYTTKTGAEKTIGFFPGSSITVPEDWESGRYRLARIETFNAIGWTGVQYRDRHFEGLGPNGEVVIGNSPIRLGALDLRVSR